MRVVDLPPEFIRRNAQDPAWLRSLPRRLDDLARRWSIHIAPPFANIEINYVAPAMRVDGTRCVLKLSRHVEETRNEIAALRLWAGDGAALLLEVEPDEGALLVERLEPGSMLAEIADADDDTATLVVAGLLRQLWRPAPGDAHQLMTLDHWCAAFERNREAILRRDSGFPRELFLRADGMRRDLLASSGPPFVLHGDMHHFNVLRAQRAEWLAIDPKGLAGDRCFDVCQFFRNPHHVGPSLNARRLDIFCAELDLDRQRTREWCFVHAMLDACWDFEDGNPWDVAIAYAEETLSF
jgi:streptomycin 6-kinase